MNTRCESVSAEVSVTAAGIGVGSRVRAALARLGHAMQRHRRVILGIQWTIVLFYAVLVVLPAFLPLPASGETILTNLTLFAQFLFWGIWWPFVILSMLLVGRMWCGVFCPEGALTEFASRHGLGRAIPRWMRWGGWPFVAFASTTLYGQLISVYEYPRATLLILGGSTVAAVGIGLVYGRNSRLWCRYLCPVSGVFGLLAKLAPVHFRVDHQAWTASAERAKRIDCAPLIDIRHMRSASQCHACGRCSGHRNAVVLSARSPNREVLAADSRDASTPAALLLVFGMLGLASGAFQWSVSPWFVALRQWAVGVLIDHEAYTLLETNAPWWLLTHYPQAGDVFTWLDGIVISVYILGYAVLSGSLSWLALRAASRLAGSGMAGAIPQQSPDWRSLSHALLPVAAAGLFLGLTMTTLNQLRAEGWVPPGVGDLRALILFGAVFWSIWLGGRLLGRCSGVSGRSVLAFALFLVPVALTALNWVLIFWVW